MDFAQMILKNVSSDYSWDSLGIIRLGREMDIAAYLSGDCRGRCLIFCHGNAETAVSEKHWFDMLAVSGVSVICPDYRGYGMSAGVLSENGCYEAAHAAYDFLSNEKKVSCKDIFILGYSLGSAIAVELAATHAVGGLILQSPFLNGKELKHFWLQKRGMSDDASLEESFPTSSRISEIHVPILIIHGTSDAVIPFSQGKELFNLAPSKEKTLISVKNAGHCDFQRQLGDDYIPLLLNFMLVRNLHDSFWSRVCRFFTKKKNPKD